MDTQSAIAYGIPVMLPVLRDAIVRFANFQAAVVDALWFRCWCCVFPCPYWLVPVLRLCMGGAGLWEMVTKRKATYCRMGTVARQWFTDVTCGNKPLDRRARTLCNPKGCKAVQHLLLRVTL